MFRHQEKAIYGRLESKVEEIRGFTKAEEFFVCLGQIAQIFQAAKNEELQELAERSNVYIDIMEAVLAHSVVRRSIQSVIRHSNTLYEVEKKKGTDRLNIQKKRLELDIDQKKFLFRALTLAVFPIAISSKFILQEKIVFMRNRLSNLISDIVDSLDFEYEFSSVCFQLSEIMQRNKYKIDEDFKFDGYYNLKFIFYNLSFARCMVGSMLVVLPQNRVLSQKMMTTTNKMNDESVQLSILKELDSLYKLVYKIRASIKSFQWLAEHSKISQEDLSVFVDKFQGHNEKNVFYFIEKLTSDCNFEPNKSFTDKVLAKIDKASDINKELQLYAKNNLQAYQGVVPAHSPEWSNRIFIISTRTLAVLDSLNHACDDRWKIKSALHEFAQWLQSTHEVVNKFRIQDDWGLIKEYYEQENDKVEWKSSFYTATESSPLDKSEEKYRQKEILKIVATAILGMINSDGGVIMVGFVENPGRIIRPDVQKHLIQKEGKSFFDLSYELSNLEKGVDDVRNELIDCLCSMTLQGPEIFNDLWNIEEFKISDGDDSAMICRVEVQKGESRIFSAEHRKDESVWISLVVRANGRTIRVDPREYA